MRILPTYLFDTLVFFAGCQLCREVQRLDFDPVTAAAALGFLITYVPVPSAARPGPVRTIFCTGTFVGMSTPLILPNASTAAAASAIGAALFTILGTRLSGIGGRLGAIAFVTTATFLAVRAVA